jgi:hypothetical protein
MTCSARASKVVAIPDSYPLDRIRGTASPPRNIAALQNWLSANSPGGNWSGKIYVADTIRWDGKRFIQKGCSPNYLADRWSLTCCKHMMRSSRPFRQSLRTPTKHAVFIFTLSKVDDRGVQHLVSVAKVTDSFSTMRSYARKLIASCQHVLIASRLSRTRTSRTNLGWRFGDCHADPTGNVGAPHPDHVHGFNQHSCWARDNTAGHELLLSDLFIVWRAPVIRSSAVMFWAGHGRNINASNLQHLLK